MHFKTYLLVALVLVLAMGMGCSSSSTTSGSITGDYASTIVGTWTQVGSNGSWPQTIVFNSNGTASESYSGGYTQSITWSLSGNQVTLSSGSTITLASIGVTTFTMSSSNGTSPTYKKA